MVQNIHQQIFSGPTDTTNVGYIPDGLVNIFGHIKLLLSQNWGRPHVHLSNVTSDPCCRFTLWYVIFLWISGMVLAIQYPYSTWAVHHELYTPIVCCRKHLHFQIAAAAMDGKSQTLQSVSECSCSGAGQASNATLPRYPLGSTVRRASKLEWSRWTAWWWSLVSLLLLGTKVSLAVFRRGTNYLRGQVHMSSLEHPWQMLRSHVLHQHFNSECMISWHFFVLSLQPSVLMHHCMLVLPCLQIESDADRPCWGFSKMTNMPIQDCMPLHET